MKQLTLRSIEQTLLAYGLGDSKPVGKPVFRQLLAQASGGTFREEMFADIWAHCNPYGEEVSPQKFAGSVLQAEQSLLNNITRTKKQVLSLNQQMSENRSLRNVQKEAEKLTLDQDYNKLKEAHLATEKMNEVAQEELQILRSTFSSPGVESTAGCSIQILFWLLLLVLLLQIPAAFARPLFPSHLFLAFGFGLFFCNFLEYWKIMLAAGLGLLALGSDIVWLSVHLGNWWSPAPLSQYGMTGIQRFAVIVCFMLLAVKLAAVVIMFINRKEVGPLGVSLGCGQNLTLRGPSLQTEKWSDYGA